MLPPPLPIIFIIAIMIIIGGGPATVFGSSQSRRWSNPSHCHYNGEGTWAIGVMEGADWGSMRAPTDDLGGGVVCPRNPILGCSDVTQVNASFVADPFLFFPNGTEGDWYAFFEVKNMNHEKWLNGKRGQIGVAVSRDEVVLRANYHMSYPHVFHHNGEIYMIPQGQSMQLFRCQSFPTVWTFEKQLIHRIPLQDVTTVFYQNRWWAFALYDTNAKSTWTLYILYADKLEGPWNHTANNCRPRGGAGGGYKCAGGDSVTVPHKSGPVGVRPGGRMFVEDGKLYRMVQDSMRLYGDGMSLNEVTSLTIDKPVEERPVEAFRDNFRAKVNVEDWNSLRFHHADLHKIPGKAGAPPRWFMLTDGDYNAGRHVVGKTFSKARCADVRRERSVLKL